MNKLEGTTLVDRLQGIEKLEVELLRKITTLINKEAKLTYTDLFFIGATKRGIAQSCGFRELLIAKNFPCAACILRMQIDTAMRVNAFRLVKNLNKLAEELFDGKQFNKLLDTEGNKLTDAYLQEKYAQQYPSIKKTYKWASDFVHLSTRHLYTSIVNIDEESREVHLLIAASDPPRPDETYFEIVDTFFEVSRLLALELLGYFGARAGLGREPETETAAP
jgi:hypothetical protein